MNVDRIKRVNELLHREIGRALYQVLRDDEVDLSAVMIAHVITHRDLRQARVLVSVRGAEEEQQRVLKRLRRHRAELQAEVMKNVVLKYTPRFHFELDRSVARGDHMLEILSELDVPPAAGEEEPEA